MFKIKNLVNIIALILFTSGSLLAQTTDYTLSEKADANGITYQYVTNDPMQTRIYTLENGLKVFISPEHSESRVQAMIGYRAGAAVEPLESTGLAHYLEHMLFKGTSKIGTVNWEKEKPLLNQISELYEMHRFTKDENQKKNIYSRIDSLSILASQYVAPNEFAKLTSVIGSSGVNAGTSYDFTYYRQNFPSNEFERWAELESERLSQVVLRLFHTELETVYEEYNRAQDNDGRQIFYSLLDNLFHEHPYKRPVLGDPDHLKNPSMVNIHKFFDTFYVPNNMLIILTGDVQAETAIPLISKYFGRLQRRELPQIKLPEEKPINQPRVSELFSDDEEKVILAYRFTGKNGPDYKFAVLVDALLSNSGKTGLMDINLNQASKIHSASSSLLFMKDYGIHYFSGIPKEGQSLEEVQGHIRAELEKIQKGEFGQWLLEAIINRMKLDRINELDNNMHRANAILYSEMYGQDYIKHVTWLQELEKITKEDLMNFVNDHYKENYVVVYKRKGAKTLQQVEKPAITPLSLVNSNESAFFAAFSKKEPEPLQPQFVNYPEEFPVIHLGNDIDFYHQEELDGNFNFRYIIPIGREHDNLLPFAIRYFRALGTSEFTPDSLKKEFYRFGINFNLSSAAEKTYMNTRGLDEHFDKALYLIRHVFENIQNDPAIYNDLVKKEQISRGFNKQDERSITFHVQQYVQFGTQNSMTNSPSIEELENQDPAAMLQKVRQLFNYKPIVFYSGSRCIGEVIPKVTSINKMPSTFAQVPPKTLYSYLPLDEPVVYFMESDMLQAQVNMVMKNDVAYSPEYLAFKDLYDNYYGVGMGSILFREIRESRGLAYSAGSYYQSEISYDEDNAVMVYMGTQANKLTEALQTMSNLLNHMEFDPEKFEFARQSSIKAIESQRMNRKFWFGSHVGLMGKGIHYDVRQTQYNDLVEMTPEKFNALFSQFVSLPNKQFFIRGKKENMDFEALKQFGRIQEVTLEDIFGY